MTFRHVIELDIEQDGGVLVPNLTSKIHHWWHLYQQSFPLNSNQPFFLLASLNCASVLNGKGILILQIESIYICCVGFKYFHLELAFQVPPVYTYVIGTWMIRISRYTMWSPMEITWKTLVLICPLNSNTENILGALLECCGQHFPLKLRRADCCSQHKDLPLNPQKRKSKFSENVKSCGN